MSNILFLTVRPAYLFHFRKSHFLNSTIRIAYKVCANEQRDTTKKPSVKIHFHSRALYAAAAKDGMGNSFEIPFGEERPCPKVAQNFPACDPFAPADLST
jgi:hypothetical protein